jgi:hypothetical protein
MLLGTPPEGTTPSEFWIDRLVDYCREESDFYVSWTATKAGSNIPHSFTLNSLCEASATYCGWLDVKALEEQSLGSSGQLHRIVTGVVSDFEPKALRAHVSAIDNQLQLITDEAAKHPDYQVSEDLWQAAKTVMDEASAFVAFPGIFKQQQSPEVLKAQLHAVRQKVEARLHEVESMAISSQPGSHGLPITHKSSVMRGNEMHIDAELMAHAQLHFEKKLEELRELSNNSSTSHSEGTVQIAPIPDQAAKVPIPIREKSISERLAG